MVATRNPLSRHDREHIFQRTVGNNQDHHNVGGLPATMHFKLIELLRKLFKDEMRELGTTLGIS